jgi:cytosine/uracil/thiamine/allantoin permease
MCWMTCRRLLDPSDWFGIQTHVGGMAIHAILMATTATKAAAAIPFLGISSPELACYMLFWSVQVYIVCKVGYACPLRLPLRSRSPNYPSAASPCSSA